MHLYDLQKTPFSQVRVHVEAWPIIGVSVATVADTIALQGRDLDYLFFAGDDLNRLTEIAAWLNENAIEWPLVAYPCKLDTGMQAIEAGATALAIDSAVSEDPAILSTRIQEFIDKFK